MADAGRQKQIEEQERLLKRAEVGSQKEAEIRARLDELKGQLEEEETQAPEAPKPPELHPALRRDYLPMLLNQVSRLELSGIDRKAVGDHAETCRLNLGAIYTALLTSGSEQDLNSKKSESEFFLQAPGRTNRQLSALEQLNKERSLVLLGDPGSGKSTFVKFVAMCLAGALLSDECTNLKLLTSPLPDTERDKDEEPAPQPWEHGPLLPLLVILRDFAAKGLPPVGQEATARHLWDFIARGLREKLLGECVEPIQRHLRDQGGLLLLDGLDEVPEADRRRVRIKQAVEQFRDLFPRCRILVTSRTYAYQQQDWRLQGFQDAVLAPFRKAQIGFFVEHWYQHMAEMRGMDRDNAQGRAELLKRAIEHSERLQDFGKRPLLLTLMASLHAWRGGSLPEKRGELYAEATDLLLDWWERNKVVRDAEGRIKIDQPSLSEMLRVGKDQVRQVLHRLAFEAHQGQTETSGTADVPEERLSVELMRICRNEKVNPILLVEHLSDRAGLLVPRGVGVYSFPHRSFQEYLAACSLTEQDDYPENIAELARQEPNRWREALLLAAAKASGIAPIIWALAEALCYRSVDEGGSTAQDAWGALLAGQALTESAKLDSISPRNRPKVKRIQEWLMAILTERQPKGKSFPIVERALAGNVLAILGDPRPGVGLRDDGLPDIEWCEVPEGEFLMGTDPEKDKIASDWMLKNEQQHKVQISAFSIGRYPVTNMQYQAFIEDGGYTRQEFWSKEAWEWKKEESISEPRWFGGEFDLSNHPVVGVSWHEALAYCQWLTQGLQATGELQEGREIRLPTEAEWEKAARGTDGRIFPWGDENITPELANYSGTNLGATSAVGCFPRGGSPDGCEEMAGNSYDWCLDKCGGSFLDVVTDTYKDGLIDPLCSSGSFRVIRGGYWGNLARFCRAASRYWHEPGYRNDYIGFRLLRT